MSHRLHEPPLRSFIQTGRALSEVVDIHRRTCPCMIDRERLAYVLGASPECELLPEPMAIDRRLQPPLLAIEDLEQLQSHAAVMLRQASIPRPPVKSNLVALLDPERSIYIRMERIDRRADHQLVANAWVIRVNNRLIPPAQRFALMAEGFHIHREAGALKLESRGEAALGWLAKKWAAYLLMPEKWVRDTWLGCDRHEGRTAAAFGVSTSAMRIRLRELGLLKCGDE